VARPTTSLARVLTAAICPRPPLEQRWDKKRNKELGDDVFDVARLTTSLARSKTTGQVPFPYHLLSSLANSD